MTVADGGLVPALPHALVSSRTGRAYPLRRRGRPEPAHGMHDRNNAGRTAPREVAPRWFRIQRGQASAIGDGMSSRLQRGSRGHETRSHPALEGGGARSFPEPDGGGILRVKP